MNSRREWSRLYYIANRERIKDKVRAYYRAHADEINFRTKVRRAKQTEPNPR